MDHLFRYILAPQTKWLRLPFFRGTQDFFWDHLFVFASLEFHHFQCQIMTSCFCHLKVVSLPSPEIDVAPEKRFYQHKDLAVHRAIMAGYPGLNHVSLFEGPLNHLIFSTSLKLVETFHVLSYPLAFFIS